MTVNYLRNRGMDIKESAREKLDVEEMRMLEC